VKPTKLALSPHSESPHQEDLTIEVIELVYASRDYAILEMPMYSRNEQNKDEEIDALGTCCVVPWFKSL
jgi:hypothetical protein